MRAREGCAFQSRLCARVAKVAIVRCAPTDRPQAFPSSSTPLPPISILTAPVALPPPPTSTSQMAAARTLQAARPEQGRDQQQLSLQSQTSGHSQAAASLAGQAASVTPRQSISKQQQQQQASQGSPASAGSSLASARSNTPPSRPSSSIFGTTTFGRKQQQQQQQSRSHSQQQHRTQSSCSSASTNLDPLGQCRICRKSILSNETCHLCSNCNQFICEDCASYSAAEQVSVLAKVRLRPESVGQSGWLASKPASQPGQRCAQLKPPLKCNPICLGLNWRELKGVGAKSAPKLRLFIGGPSNLRAK